MTERDTNIDFKQIREEFASLQKEVAAMTNMLRDIGGERLEDAKASAAKRLRAGAEELRRRADSAELRGREAVDELGATISSHPVGSMAIAFGIGFLVSKLFELGNRR